MSSDCVSFGPSVEFPVLHSCLQIWPGYNFDMRKRPKSVLACDRVRSNVTLRG